jgi:hypothetical protein
LNTLLSIRHLTSAERSRVLRSIIKLRRILGEPLSEEAVNQWIVLPNQRAKVVSHPAVSCHGDADAFASLSLSAEYQALDDQITPSLTRFQQKTSGEKVATMRRTAKPYSLLGERVDADSPHARVALIDPTKPRSRQLCQTPNTMASGDTQNRWVVPG